MSGIVNFFKHISHVIDDACKAIANVVKAASNAFIGAFKALYDCTLALAKAIESGNLAAIAENLLKLGAAIATIADPELLAVQVGAQTAMSAVKETMQLAAKTCGFKEQPWMKKTMGMMSEASNFTSFGQAATAMGTELTAKLAGEKGPLQTEWEQSMTTPKSEDKTANNTVTTPPPADKNAKAHPTINSI